MKIESRATYLERFDVNVKEYLSLNEIGFLVNTAMEYDDLVEKDYFVSLALLKLATDIDESELDNIDIDLAYSSGLVESVKDSISNYYLVERYINKYEDITYKVKEIFNELSAFADKLPDIDTLTAELGKLQDVSAGLKSVK